jgi:endonuclease YncB( thermonuclease family)
VIRTILTISLFLIFLPDIAAACTPPRYEGEVLPPCPMHEERPAQTHFPMELERVVDGDTIIASDTKIRLWGIDTPEKGENHTFL